MRKLSSTIGRALTSAYILYSCRHTPKSGYRLMRDAKDMVLAAWSAGSFYPIINGLLKEGMLTKKKAKGASRRLTYEYAMTAAGKKYLRKISGYFKNPQLRSFMVALIEGDFDDE